MPNKILYIDVRRGVTAACWAHNPEVAGSSPAVATKANAGAQFGDFIERP